MFKTDDNFSYFLITLPIHSEATKKITDKPEPVALQNQTHQLKSKTHQLKPKTHQLKPKTHQLTDEIQQNKEKLPLVKDGLLKYVYSERGSSPNQAYKAR